ncbi:hypothetical protein Bbelb_109230 [Branchiostoma belcheri]|nr:hypothetical protein Bbelb_109230 [Branchiostoma belcheri]
MQTLYVLAQVTQNLVEIPTTTRTNNNMGKKGTSLAIFHIGSNDLDNTRQDESSVQDCLQKTEELVTRAKMSFPNATIVLSQVLPRGHVSDSSLNRNIKNYNQSVPQTYKDADKMPCIRRKKLSTSKHLYKRNGIHLDDFTGTSLLVADFKRTIRSMENTHDQPRPGQDRGRAQRPAVPLDRPTKFPDTTNRAQQYRGRDRSTYPRRADEDYTPVISKQMFRWLQKTVSNGPDGIKRAINICDHSLVDCYRKSRDLRVTTPTVSVILDRFNNGGEAIETSAWRLHSGTVETSASQLEPIPARLTESASRLADGHYFLPYYPVPPTIPSTLVILPQEGRVSRPDQ